MNTLELALTWTLIHSLWVAFAIWLVVNCMAALFKSSQHIRLLKVAGAGTFALCMLVVFVYQLLPDAGITGKVTPVVEQTSSQTNRMMLLVQKIDSSVNWGSEVIPQIWMLGLVYGIIRLVYTRRSLLHYRKSALPCFDDDINSAFSRVSERLAVKRRAFVLVSPLVNSPMTTGVFKPLVYLPAGLVSGFSTDELEAIFMHELLHIKRHDYLVNLLLVSLETIFFFNPVVLLMARDLRKAMEFACDDSVLQRVNKLEYAKVLLRLQMANVSRQVGLAAKGATGEFKERIDRIVGKAGRRPSHTYSAVPLILLCTLLLASAFGFKKPVKHNHEELFSVTGQTTPQEDTTEQQQDTTELLKLVWPEDSDTLVFEGRTFVWHSNKERPEFIKIKRHHLEKLNQEIIKVISGAPLRKADKMMAEIQEELMRDGILSEDRPRITLMFQYSDILNGQASLGKYYEKYKDIFNLHFPKYDSFASTRVFRYKSK